jgi:hypothetical protein
MTHQPTPEMTPQRRRQLLEASRLGRAVIFAAPAGAKGDLDPDGRWRTVSGNKIHITADGEIDAGGHPVLRQILAEKAGLKVKGANAGDEKPGDAAGRAERRAALTEQIAAAGREVIKSPRVERLDLKPGDYVYSTVDANRGVYRVEKLTNGGKGVTAVLLEDPASKPVRLAPRKGIGGKPEWNPPNAYDGYNLISEELAQRVVDLAQRVAGTKPMNAPGVAPPPGAPGVVGSAGANHPVQGSREEQAKLIGSLNGSDDPDPMRLRADGPPKGLDMKAFTSDVRGMVGRHAAMVGAGAPLETLYGPLAKKYNLSKHDFLRAVAPLIDDDVLRGVGWPKTTHDIPDLQLAPSLQGRIVGYLGPKTGYVSPVGAFDPTLLVS